MIRAAGAELLLLALATLPAAAVERRVGRSQVIAADALDVGSARAGLEDALASAVFFLTANSSQLS